MRKALVLAGVVALGACSRNKPKSFSGPANMNGLECALRVATDSAFVAERGGLAQGFVFLQRNRGNSVGEREITSRTSPVAV